jgi:AAA domain
MSDYPRLAKRAAEPQKIRDHTACWDKLQPVGAVNGTLAERIEEFCAAKTISLAALEALGTRVATRRGGSAWLAFAGRNGAGTVTALKYRPLGGSSHDSEAEAPSVWLRPNVIGRLDSLDWFLAEGETDAARLYDLVGDAAAVLVLPAGALTFKSEWADMIPRGATVHLCHDADEDGDAGAEKTARILGGKTVRVRPPEEGLDWCDWGGTRQQFVELVAATRAEKASPTFLRLDEFLAAEYPPVEVLLGDPETIIYLARGTFALTYGDGGAGKSTFEVDAVAHLAAGRDWLGIPVPRAVRVLIIENENAPALFQQKLADKAEQWDADPSWRENVYVYAKPWGKFTFTSADARRHLREFCETERIDLITANPLFGVGGPGAGRPDETSAFVELLKELGLGLDGPAIWPLHHENKVGQVSGDWNRQPDTLIALARDGDNQATKLSWEKVRWTRQAPEGWRKKWLLEWETEHKGYTVLEVDLRGVSDTELEERIADFLSANPQSSKKTIENNVSGNSERIRMLLDAGVDAGRYVREKGFRGAQLHSLAADVVPSLDDLADDLDGN